MIILRQLMAKQFKMVRIFFQLVKAKQIYMTRITFRSEAREPQTWPPADIQTVLQQSETTEQNSWKNRTRFEGTKGVEFSK